MRRRGPAAVDVGLSHVRVLSGPTLVAGGVVVEVAYAGPGRLRCPSCGGPVEPVGEPLDQRTEILHRRAAGDWCRVLVRHQRCACDECGSVPPAVPGWAYPHRITEAVRDLVVERAFDEPYAVIAADVPLHASGIQRIFERALEEKEASVFVETPPALGVLPVRVFGGQRLALIRCRPRRPTFVDLVEGSSGQDLRTALGRLREPSKVQRVVVPADAGYLDVLADNAFRLGDARWLVDRAGLLGLARGALLRVARASAPGVTSAQRARLARPEVGLTARAQAALDRFLAGQPVPLRRAHAAYQDACAIWTGPPAAAQGAYAWWRRGIENPRRLRDDVAQAFAALTGLVDGCCDRGRAEAVFPTDPDDLRLLDTYALISARARERLAARASEIPRTHSFFAQRGALFFKRAPRVTRLRWEGVGETEITQGWSIDHLGEEGDWVGENGRPWSLRDVFG